MGLSHVLILSCLAAVCVLAAAEKPNVIIINADDLGFGDIASWGHPTSYTPNLDAMAQRGARLVQYYSAANICSPSRGSLLTGRLFRRLGIYPGVFSPLSNGGLPLNETTMAASLKTVGYRTGGLGKWHLGTQQFHPTSHGFDFYFGAPMTQNECYSNIDYPGKEYATWGSHCLDIASAGQFGPCPIFNGTSALAIQAQGNVDMLNVDELYDAAVHDFITNATDHQEPFFFYFASHHTHAPQFAPDALRGTTRRGLFGDSLFLLDRSVGRIIDLLDTLGVTNNTLLIFTADNGGSLQWEEIGGVNGDLRCGKGTTFEGGHRVPTMAMWPGKIAAGAMIQDMTSSLDWYPTLANLAGFEIQKDLAYDGMDISHCLFGQGACGRDTFFYHSTKIDGPISRPGALMAVRKGQYKLHMWTQGSHCQDGYPDQACWASSRLGNHTAEPLLYNLERDPGEKNILAPDTWGEFNETHTYNATVQDLTELFYNHIKEFSSAPSQIDKGSNADRFPCCSPGCTPKPHCCKCASTSTDFL